MRTHLHKSVLMLLLVLLPFISSHFLLPHFLWGYSLLCYISLTPSNGLALPLLLHKTLMRFSSKLSWLLFSAVLLSNLLFVKYVARSYPPIFSGSIKAFVCSGLLPSMHKTIQDVRHTSNG